MRLSTPVVAYFNTSVGIALLHTIYASYFVDYVQRRHRALHFSDFAAVQILLAAWHMVAEFLFGVFAASHRTGGTTGQSAADDDPVAVSRRRLHRATQIGCGASVAFLAVWMVPRLGVAWGVPDGLSVLILTVAIVAFDGCMSYVNVHLKALIADADHMSASDRESSVLMGSFATMCGSMGAAAAGYWYTAAASSTAASPTTDAVDGSNTFGGFDAVLCLASVAAAGAFVHAGAIATRRRHALVSSPLSAAESGQELTSDFAGHKVAAAGTAQSPMAATTWTELCRQRLSSVAFVLRYPAARFAMVIWFAQELCCTFQTNFFVVAATSALRGSSPLLLSLVLLASFALPQVAVVVGVRLNHVYGLRRVLLAFLAVRSVIGFAAGIVCATSLVSDDLPGIVVLCMLLLRFTTEGVCKLQNLALGEITTDVESDHKRVAAAADAGARRRTGSGEAVDLDATLPTLSGTTDHHDAEFDAASLLAGITSLAAKPAQCLAPILGSWIFFVSSTTNAGNSMELTGAQVASVSGWVAMVTALVTIPAWAGVRVSAVAGGNPAKWM